MQSAEQVTFTDIGINYSHYRHTYLQDVPCLVPVVCVHVLIFLCWAEQLDRCFDTPSHGQVNVPSLSVGEDYSDSSTIL